VKRVRLSPHHFIGLAALVELHGMGGVRPPRRQESRMLYRVIVLSCCMLWGGIGPLQAQTPCAAKCLKGCAQSKKAARQRCEAQCRRHCVHEARRCHRRCEMVHLRGLRACVKKRPDDRAGCLRQANAARTACQGRCPAWKRPSAQAKRSCLARCVQAAKAHKAACRRRRKRRARKRCLSRVHRHRRHCATRCQSAVRPRSR